MQPIEETLFELPSDVVIVPVRRLSPSMLRQIEWREGDFAVSRPRLRRPSKVVDEASAALLEEFRSPTTIVDAILRYSAAHKLDPNRTLEDSFEALRSLVAGQVLLPAGSEDGRRRKDWLAAGMCVGGFEIVRLLQALEDSALYEAVDAHGERVALKTSENMEMLEREAAVLEHLQGRVAPRFLTRGNFERNHYLAMEWVSGANILAPAARLRGGGRAEQNELHRLCVRLLDAFADLHGAGVVHGDVHPGNILVRADGSVCVLDFGRSRFVQAGHPFFLAGRAGIGYYYEPELARAIRCGEPHPQASAAGEQYALAGLVYLLMTGGYYQDLSLEMPRLLEQVVEGEMLPFSQRGVAPWPDAEDVLRRALAKEPGERFASVAEFASRLGAITPPKSELPVAGNASEWLLNRMDLSGALFREGLKTPPAASVAYGAAGLAYLLYRAALVRADPRLLSMADAWAQRVDIGLAESFAAPAIGLTEATVRDSCLYGAPGVHVIRALIADARFDGSGWVESCRDFLASISNENAPPDIAFGRAGWLIAVSSLLELRPGAIEFRTWAGEALARGVSFSPLSGMAHGTAGQLYAILRTCRALGVPPPKPLLSTLGSLAMEAPPEWPGWCRGSAGLLHLWALAHTVTGDKTFLKAGERAALAAFQNPDRNPDLCCGLAGRAFGLLRWYQHTGDPRWLHCARQLTDAAQAGAAFCERPYSLFKGAAGVALLTIEMEEPERASMPPLIC